MLTLAGGRAGPAFVGGPASVRLFTGDVVAMVAPDVTLQEAAERLVADDVGPAWSSARTSASTVSCPSGPRAGDGAGP
jgi:hypothetical protein